MLTALVLSLCGILAFSPQVVVSIFNTIEFSSIQQCGPFSVTFSGGKAPLALPLTLTIIPFNSTPISIPIPNDAWNPATSTGAAVTFLPLPAGATFVASLDDANGYPTGLVSDVIAIDSSSNSSCLPPPSESTQRSFNVDPTTIAQCAPFNVTFDQAAGVGVPRVRGFMPRGFSLFMDETSESPSTGAATYVMEGLRGLEVALLLDDGQGHRETTPIMSILGDSTSTASCIHVNISQISSAHLSNSSTSSLAANTSKGISSGALVAIAVVSSSIVGGVLILLGLYIWRERKRRQALKIQMDAERQSRYDEKPRGVSDDFMVLPPAPMSPIKSPTLLGVRHNPAYVNAKFTKSPMSPEFIQYPRIDDDRLSFQRSPALQSAGLRSLGREASLGRSKRRPSMQTLRSLDIEQILARATIYEEDRRREREEAEAEAADAVQAAPSYKPSRSTPPPAFNLDSPRKDVKELNVPQSPAYSFVTTTNDQPGVDVPYTPVSDYTRISSLAPPPRARLADDGSRTSSYTGAAL
ncbi:hypothetical protein NEOLEDRAFT_1176792 [Neolentinus lepideus HHB14362 ss-1]|uniref:Dystroglycan-type cadherin-like domain-containing protein n=1 Tax=Neolentinus lepideus HHB14362 ss-1 TaxID=1314782 RepID=A0A165TYM0_9AGAM|nr:hypothetical protein NEOLEDRAFT_1176792 [Neolentinus lepideus HHB14362 ss-1]